MPLVDQRYAIGVTASGTDSVSVSPASGCTIRIVRIIAIFPSSSGGSGTLQIKEGSTVKWQASVNGYANVEFPGYWSASAADTALTVVLTGADIHVDGGYEVFA